MVCYEQMGLTTSEVGLIFRTDLKTTAESIVLGSHPDVRARTRKCLHNVRSRSRILDFKNVSVLFCSVLFCSVLFCCACSLIDRVSD